MKQRVHQFFESPSTLAGKIVQGLIAVLILLSVFNVGVEFVYPDFFKAYQNYFIWAEWIIVAVFTVEYGLRLLTADRRLRWIRRPLNVVDFVAIAPFYVELLLPLFMGPSTQAVRLLRLARLIRAFRLFRLKDFLSVTFGYRGTILESITPVIAIFALLKGVVWLMETTGWWVTTTNLEQLFALVGFALGIILSQKIGVTYNKFLQVEEAVIRICATLRTVEMILNQVQTGLGTSACRQWAKMFSELLHDPNSDNQRLTGASERLYEAMSKAESQPAEIATLHCEIARDAAFCLSKKHHITPKAYDTLLHQATIVYLVLLAVFLRGWPGMVSVVVATYTLYGMYGLTQDFDSVLGGEHNLIDINTSELKQFAGELDAEPQDAG